MEIAGRTIKVEICVVHFVFHLFVFNFVDDNSQFFCLWLTDIEHQIQVSCVTDHVASQDATAKSADLDDDEGGLVSLLSLYKIFKD